MSQRFLQGRLVSSENVRLDFELQDVSVMTMRYMIWWRTQDLDEAQM